MVRPSPPSHAPTPLIPLRLYSPPEPLSTKNVFPPTRSLKPAKRSSSSSLACRPTTPRSLSSTSRPSRRTTRLSSSSRKASADGRCTTLSSIRERVLGTSLSSTCGSFPLSRFFSLSLSWGLLCLSWGMRYSLGGSRMGGFLAMGS